MLEDEVVRAKEGDEIELMRLAKDKVAKDLGKYHTYVDGTIDRPLLNSETVMFED
jgi:5-hydroxyisourate hydrolase-like protein (transthyretin family)